MSIKSIIRIVIDTNLIIAGRYNSKSASNKIIDLCIEGRLLAAYSDTIRNENMHILEKVRPPAEYLSKIRLFYSKSVYIPKPQRIDICSDKSDNKYFEAAIDCQAQYIISNDRHLLEHDGYYGIHVMRPAEFLRKIQNVQN